MKLVGLTGGIACGKSSVTRLLRMHGITVIDADNLAREVCAKGRWGHRRVLRAFGPSVLRSDGELDREAIAALVFADSAARRRLNAATHPAVGLALALRIAAAWARCEPLVMVDMPLLFESGFYRLCRPCILVACSEHTQLARLAARDGLGAAAAQARVAAQMPLAAKRRLAGMVLENDGSLQELEERVRQLTDALRRHTWVHRCLLSPVGLGLLAAAVVLWPR